MATDGEIVVLIDDSDYLPSNEDNQTGDKVIPTNEESCIDKYSPKIPKLQSGSNNPEPADAEDPTAKPSPQSPSPDSSMVPVREEDDESISLILLSAEEPTVQDIIAQQSKEPPELWTRNFSKSEGYITYLSRIWVPPAIRAKLVDAVHLLPPYHHPRAQKMHTLISKLYNWEGMWNYLTSYVKSCYICQLVQSRKASSHQTSRRHPIHEPFDYVYIDFWGPLI